MCVKNGYTPVVVMIEGGDGTGNQTAREWMENSRFNTTEARDIFEALEEMGDFTTESRPEVILLDVENCKADLPLVKGTFESVNQNEVSIMAISEISEASFDRGAFEGNLEAVVAHLDEILPETAV